MKHLSKYGEPKLEGFLDFFKKKPLSGDDGVAQKFITRLKRAIDAKETPYECESNVENTGTIHKEKHLISFEDVDLVLSSKRSRERPPYIAGGLIIAPKTFYS